MAQRTFTPFITSAELRGGFFQKAGNLPEVKELIADVLSEFDKPSGVTTVYFALNGAQKVYSFSFTKKSISLPAGLMPDGDEWEVPSANLETSLLPLLEKNASPSKPATQAFFTLLQAAVELAHQQENVPSLPAWLSCFALEDFVFPSIRGTGFMPIGGSHIRPEWTCAENGQRDLSFSLANHQHVDFLTIFSDGSVSIGPEFGKNDRQQRFEATLRGWRKLCLQVHLAGLNTHSIRMRAAFPLLQQLAHSSRKIWRQHQAA